MKFVATHTGAGPMEDRRVGHTTSSGGVSTFGVLALISGGLPRTPRSSDCVSRLGQVSTMLWATKTDNEKAALKRVGPHHAPSPKSGLTKSANGSRVRGALPIRGSRCRNVSLQIARQTATAPGQAGQPTYRRILEIRGPPRFRNVELDFVSLLMEAVTVRERIWPYLPDIAT